MTNTNPGYILKLIETSQALTKEKKVWWVEQLATMDEFRKAKFVHLLEEEAKVIAQSLQNQLGIRKRYAHKKIQALYDYAERKIEQDEEIELALLDKELEQIN